LDYCEAHRQVEFGDEGIPDQSSLEVCDRKRLRPSCGLCGDCSRDVAVVSACGSEIGDVDEYLKKQYNLSKEIWS
jgi:hypothetical protein